MIVLGLESTCDETSWALVRDGSEILFQTIASQVDLHALYGGVFPELACRRHVDVLIPLLHQTLIGADLALDDIDLIAVALGPGLAGALLLGAAGAKSLALALQRPLVGVHHLEAHLYSAVMNRDLADFEGLGLILSGGHTLFVEIEQMGSYRLIGQTLDDAIGESFDKVAVLLGMTYPGGEKIEQLAKRGDPIRYAFKAPGLKDRPFAFSYSGLKTAIAQMVFKMGGEKKLTDRDRCDLAASFQRAAIETIIAPISRYFKDTGENLKHKRLLLGGGVARNEALRATLQSAFPQMQLLAAPFDLCSDNAAMIAGLGFHRFQNNAPSGLFQSTRPKWPITEQ